MCLQSGDYNARQQARVHTRIGGGGSAIPQIISDDTNACIECIINLNHCCLVSTKLLLYLLPSKLPLCPAQYSEMFYTIITVVQ